MPINFCSNCGNNMQWSVPLGDHQPRFNCARCGFIAYENPHIIVGCLPIWKNKIMLCKRGIEPRKGFWNLPGGFMENSETIEQGAAREMREETGAEVTILSLHSVFSVPEVNQLHIHFLAAMRTENFMLTPESIEIELFDSENIPWSTIAFASNDFTLRTYVADQKNQKRSMHIGSTATHRFSPVR